MAETRRKEIIIRVCCVIAAFILWLYTSNDDNVSETYKVSNIPIEIINQDYLIEAGLTLSPNQKFTTSLNVSGKPAEIYALKPAQFKLTADLSIYAMKRGENRIPVNIVKRPNGNYNILNDSAMWISVEVDNHKDKTMPVQVQIKGETKVGFNNDNPIIKPENVVISGSESYVDTVVKVIAEVDIDGQNKNVNETVPLIAVDKMGKKVAEITLSESLAQVVIPIQKVKEVGVNIKTTGELPENFILKDISLSKDKFTIMGSPSVLAGIGNLDTEPIDLSKFNEESSSIEVKLVLPSNVKIIEGNNIIRGEILLDQVVEKNVTPKINYKNLSNGFYASLDKDSVSVVVSGGRTTIDEVDTSDIICYIDLENLYEGEYTIPIGVDVPQGVNVVSQGAKFVKVIISKSDSGNDNTEETTNPEETEGDRVVPRDN